MEMDDEIREELDDILNEKKKKLDSLYETTGVTELQEKQEALDELQKKSGELYNELSDIFITLLNVVLEQGTEISHNIVVKNGKVIDKESSLEQNLRSLRENNYLERGVARNMCKSEYREQFFEVMERLEYLEEKSKLVNYMDAAESEVNIELDDEKTLVYRLNQKGFVIKEDIDWNLIRLDTYNCHEASELIEYRKDIRKAMNNLEKRFREFIECIKSLIEFIDDKFLADMVSTKI